MVLPSREQMGQSSGEVPGRMAAQRHHLALLLNGPQQSFLPPGTGKHVAEHVAEHLAAQRHHLALLLNNPQQSFLPPCTGKHKHVPY